MRCSIFIDGNNFYYGLKSIYPDNKQLMLFNYEKLCNFLAGDKEIIRICYYNAPLDITKDLEKYKSQQRFFEKLKKIPKMNLVLCRLLKRIVDGRIFYVLKEDDINMAVDLVKGAFKNEYDTAILISGDGDFVPAVKVAQEENKKIENIYFKKTASSNLRFNCDKSILLKKEILDKFFDPEKSKEVKKVSVEEKK